MELEKRQDFEMIDGGETRLCDLIGLYLRENEMTAVSLFTRAGLTHSIFTTIKTGSMPEPETVRKLADTMNLSRGRLFFLSGYLQKNDLRLTYELSPDDEFFLHRYRGLPEVAKDMIRAGIKVAVKHEDSIYYEDSPYRAKEMPESSGKLYEFITLYLREHNIKPSQFLKNAGIPHSTYTQMRKGSRPGPETISKLAASMAMSKGHLFLLGGYLQTDDLRFLYGLSSHEEILLNNYRKIPNIAKHVVRSVLDGMIQGDTLQVN